MDASESLFRRVFGAAPAVRARAPGRVNLIGEHVDYNAGPVLPMPLAQGTSVALAPRADRIVRIAGEDVAPLAAPLELDLDALPPREVRGFAAYPLAVVLALAATGKRIAGFDLAIAGDLPIGAGLSSSASLLVAVARALDEVFAVGLSPSDVAMLANRAEREHVGVECGIMDSMASALGREGNALFLDCRDASWRQVPIDASSIRVLVVDSATRRELKGSEYNARVADCRRAVAALATRDPAVRTLRDATLPALAAVAADLPATAERRARCVIREIARVFDFERALLAGDFERCGAHLRESHADLRDLYEISTPALDFLAAALAAHRGVFGARLTGAGFGGCLVALARPGAEDAIEREVAGAYRERFGLEARVIRASAT